MVPPRLVTASRWEPGRPWSSPGPSIPDQARLERGEVVGRIPAAEQVQDRIQDRAGQSGEWGGPLGQGQDLVHRPFIPGGLVACLVIATIRRARTSSGLRGRRSAASIPSGEHSLDDHRAGDQVTAILRQDHARPHRSDLMAGTADPLQPWRQRWAGLDLDDHVDRSHVDAQFKAAGGDHGRQSARLQVDDGSMLAADGPWGRDRLGTAVRGARRVRGLVTVRSDVIDARGDPLGQSTGVGEDDGGPCSIASTRRSSI
jgi:hypothetical protein